MGRGGGLGWAPVVAPVGVQMEDQWRHFDSSVNAVSFGFVATAILISMFLVMAVFERFLRPNSAAGGRSRDIESQTEFNGKMGHPSPKMTVYANGVSVLMPGDDIPTFIAHPAPIGPIHCPPEQFSSPHKQHPSSTTLPQNPLS